MVGEAAKSVEPEVPRNGGVVRFDVVFRSELACVDARRQFLNDRSSHPAVQDAPAVKKRQPDEDLVGLALSGGGIRSAAFCLGVLQALNVTPSSKPPPKQGVAGQQPPPTPPPPTLLERVDYLSTVSGGGYIGCSLAGSLSNRGGGFPFASNIEGAELDFIKHIRDNSNYLFPNGLLDFFPNFAIYLRGLSANCVIVLPLILAFAAFTIYCSPASDNLLEPRFFAKIFGKSLAAIFGSFAFTKLVLSVLVLLLLVWGLSSIVYRVTAALLWRIVIGFVRSAWNWLKQRTGPLWEWLGDIRAKTWSWLDTAQKALPSFMSPIIRIVGSASDAKAARLSEVDSRWAKFGSAMLIVLAVCVFCELQPLVLHSLFERAAEFEKAAAAARAAAETAAQAKQPAPAPVPPDPNFYVSIFVAVLTAIASIVGLLADKLEKVSKYFSQVSGVMARIIGGSSRLIIYLASAALPLTLWILYLLISFWGIASPIFGERKFAAPDWLFGLASSLNGGLHSLIEHVGFVKWAYDHVAFVKWAYDILHGIPILSPLIDWIIRLVDAVLKTVIGATSAVGGLYLLVAVILFVLSMLPTINANSLHRLYRDRLSNAFIFYEPTPSAWTTFMRTRLVSRLADFFQRLVPGEKGWKKKRADEAERDDTKIRGLDKYKLTELQARFSPYLIVNTALNIQGSKYVNRRGRNADFFLFSRNYTGSEATGYVATGVMEGVTPDLNLATAMAVSGAAASSNMGSRTIRSLAPTLTILNIRLGYWLRNPHAALGGIVSAIARAMETANYYVFKEMFGQLSELSYNVYLTDGGHIEHLGIYQLLKRHCKLIIVVDAEADAAMNFGSFVTLQRYARIDLGVRIDLPWQEIRTATLDTGKSIAENSPDVPTFAHAGPHCAVGVIEYSETEYGFLFYIKSSMSGDENDYIIDYKRRNPAFPHETTEDQMFSEEQFEVYRALGFHAAYGAFSSNDKMVTLARRSKRIKQLKWNSSAKADNPLSEIQQILKV